MSFLYVLFLINLIPSFSEKDVSKVHYNSMVPNKIFYHRPGSKEYTKVPSLLFGHPSLTAPIHAGARLVKGCKGATDELYSWTSIDSKILSSVLKNPVFLASTSSH